jgi:hypothetical protein
MTNAAKRIYWLWMVLVLTIPLSVAACGSSGVETAPANPLVAVVVDCTISSQGDQKTWARQIATLASDVLAEDRTLRVGRFGGTLTGVEWLPTYAGSSLPNMTGGERARRSAQRAWGRSLEPILYREIQVRTQPGTDWLSALQAASEESGLHSVYLFSDLVQEAEGINLTQEKSSAELENIAHSWAPRLIGLRNRLVISVGGGEKLSGEQPDTQGVTLFEDLARLVPFRAELLSTL